MEFCRGLAQNLEVPYTESAEVRRLEMAKSSSGTVSRLYHNSLSRLGRDQGYCAVTEFVDNANISNCHLLAIY